MKEISEVKDMMDGFHASNKFLIHGLREIASRLVVEEQTLSHNLKSHPQQENHQVTTIRSLILPTYVEENESGHLFHPTFLEEKEVSREYVDKREVDESALELKTQIDFTIETLTLVEEEKFTQENAIQQTVKVEHQNMTQLDTSILRLRTHKIKKRNVLTQPNLKQ
ncbi:unnamed protein product [Prunus armeniaca]|uniref:Uncharacterized protein n=1 Tax=Prunus armeniaca TaxID=36596 RepID=A0A6J5WQK2_PRUAR|nr:unnamed protein product [Prunus armeniaca]